MGVMLVVDERDMRRMKRRIQRNLIRSITRVEGGPIYIGEGSPGEALHLGVHVKWNPREKIPFLNKAVPKITIGYLDLNEADARALALELDRVAKDTIDFECKNAHLEKALEGLGWKGDESWNYETELFKMRKS